MLLVKKYEFFLYLDLVKIRLAIILNNFVEKEKTFEENFSKKLFKTPKNPIFQKGLTHALGQKMEFFSLFDFGQIRTWNKL